MIWKDGLARLLTLTGILACCACGADGARGVIASFGTVRDGGAGFSRDSGTASNQGGNNVSEQGGDAASGVSVASGGGVNAQPRGDASVSTAGADGSAPGAGQGTSSGPGQSGSGQFPGAWLAVSGNKLLTPDGKPFHGRGANLHDMRSCNACTWQAPNPTGVMAWADELIDHWHANFIRFALESYPDNAGYRNAGQWKTIADDPQYLADVRSVVRHMTAKPGVYVMVSLWVDATMVPNGQSPHSEWPTDATMPIYQKLAEAFYDDPQVLFGLTNEPHDAASSNADLAAVFNKAIQTIRDVEAEHGAPAHIIVAQGTQGWARDLSYWVGHPLTAAGGKNIAYETHPYNPQSDFDALFVQPSKKIPVIIGEFGPPDDTHLDDVKALMQVAEQNEIPYLAWNFHQRCDPNLLLDQGTQVAGAPAYDSCGMVGAGTTYIWPPTEFGKAFKNQLAQPW